MRTAPRSLLPLFRSEDQVRLLAYLLTEPNRSASAAELRAAHLRRIEEAVEAWLGEGDGLFDRLDDAGGAYYNGGPKRFAEAADARVAADMRLDGDALVLKLSHATEAVVPHRPELVRGAAWP